MAHGFPNSDTPSFRVRIRIPPEDASYLRRSPRDDFVPEVVDVSVQFEFDGLPPSFPPDDQRVTEGLISNVPVFDFLRGFISACGRIVTTPSGRERAYVTSTDYTLEFIRKNREVDIRLIRVHPDGGVSVIASSSGSLRQFAEECVDVCRTFLFVLSDMNSNLRSDDRFQDLEAKVVMVSERFSADVRRGPRWSDA